MAAGAACMVRLYGYSGSLVAGAACTVSLYGYSGSLAGSRISTSVPPLSGQRKVRP